MCFLLLLNIVAELVIWKSSKSKTKTREHRYWVEAGDMDIRKAKLQEYPFLVGAYPKPKRTNRVQNPSAYAGGLFVLDETSHRWMEE